MKYRLKHRFFILLLLILSAVAGFLSMRASRTNSANPVGQRPLPVEELRARAAEKGVARFRPVSTFRVSGKVAEIVAATPDGQMLVYTDSQSQEIGFVGISDPVRPKQAGVLRVAGEPTSVAVTSDGRWLLCVVHGAPDHLLVIDAETRQIVRKITLRGQPDSVAISSDGRYGAIAIENERSDQEAPMPQKPAGFVTIVDIIGAPTVWKLRHVPLQKIAQRFPNDPEPEFITINSRNQAAVTLQENNHVVLIDLGGGKVLGHWSTDTTSHAADLLADGRIDFSEQLISARREPDAIAWTPGGNLITANEGDYDLDLKPTKHSGGRNWTVFSSDGKIVYDDTQVEMAVKRAGLYPDKRSSKHGVEPESVAVARFKGQALAFIGCERSNCVVVYAFTNESRPQLLQVLPTGASPEGLLTIPGRSLLVTANEGDGTLSIFQHR